MQSRLACADFTFPLLSHQASLQLIQSMEFQGVDIGLFEDRSHLQPSQEFQSPEESGNALRELLGDFGLTVADVFLQMDPDFVPFALNHIDNGRRAKARDWFLRCLDYTEASGSRHITVLPGVHFPEEPAAESLARTEAELAWRLEQANPRGLAFSIEAHVGSIVPSPQTALSLLQKISGLTLTLDYTHFTRQGVPDAQIEVLVPHASHFHFRGARHGRLQASWSENIIDYGRVLDLMAKHSYQGWHAVEYVWSDWEHCNECDNVSETVLFRDFIRSHNQN